MHSESPQDRLLTGKRLGALCATTLGVILTLGLWPFCAPRNAVAWIPGSNGLLFGDAGTAVSRPDFPPAAPPGAPCSLEIWAKPARTQASGTLAAFYTPRNRESFALRQSLSDLALQRSGPGTSRFYVNDVFRAARPVFLTISSGPHGTAVYVDGVLRRAASGFRIGAAACSGRLVVGTSPIENDSWTGVLRGLAIYRSEIGLAAALRHYQTWSRDGHPAQDAGDASAALFLFDERGGDWAYDRNPAGPDLFLPQEYELQNQAFLEPFWQEFELSWSYFRSAVKNIVGFVPLGFFFYAWFLTKAPARRATRRAVLLGFAVSLTIEVLQGFLPTRDSGTTDLITNTLGTWLGVLLFRRVGPALRAGGRNDR
jgi:hypothetical protein